MGHALISSITVVEIELPPPKSVPHRPNRQCRNRPRPRRCARPCPHRRACGRPHPPRVRDQWRRPRHRRQLMMKRSRS